MTRAGLRVRWVSTPVLLPHEMMSYIAARGKRRFQACFLRKGTWEQAESDVAGWWQHHRDRDWCQRVMVSEQQRNHCLPVCLYGDDAPVNKVESLTIITWSSLLGQKSAWDTRLLICVLPKKWHIKHVTLAPIWKVIAWSLQVMRTGTWPATDWQGRPWPPGSFRADRAGTPLVQLEGIPWNATLAQIRTDWSFQSDHFGVPHWVSARVCYRCEAGQHHPTPYYDFRENAAWCNRLLSHDAFMASVDASKNAVLEMGEFHRDLLVMEPQHSVHLGFSQLVNANVILELIGLGVFGARLDAFYMSWNTFQKWCREVKVHTSQPQWTDKSFGLPGPPEMGTKAWNARLITAWLRVEWLKVVAQDR